MRSPFDAVVSNPPLRLCVDYAQRVELQASRLERLARILAHYRARPRYSAARYSAICRLRDWQWNDAAGVAG